MQFYTKINIKAAVILSKDIFIVVLLPLFIGIFPSFGNSQEKKDTLDLSLLYKKEKAKDDETQLLNFLKEWDIDHFNNKSTYIHFITKKGKGIKANTSETYAEAAYRIAKILYQYNDPYKAYEFLEKTETALENKDLSTVYFAADHFKLKGNIYFNFRRYAKSKTAFSQSLQLNTLKNRSTIDAYNTLGLIYRHENAIDSSIYAFNQALDLAKKTNNEDWKGIVIGNLGYTHYMRQDFKIAKEYLKIDQRLSLLNHENESALSATSTLIEIALKQNSTEEIKKNISIIDSLNNLVSEFSAKHNYFLVKTKYWEYLGDYEKAYSAFQKRTAYNDSLNQKHNQTDFQNMEFQIDFEKKNAETQLLIEQEKRNKQYYYSVVIILLIFIIASIVLIYQLRKRRVNERKVLQLRNEKIQYELKTNEKELSKLLKNLTQKNKIIDALNEEIKSKEQQEETKSLQKEKQVLHDKIHSFTLLTESDLVEFKHVFNKINPGFYDSILQRYPNLTKSETRLTMLIRLGLTTFEMAQILGISEDSVRKTNFRLRKKLSINSTEELSAFIRSI